MSDFHVTPFNDLMEHEASDCCACVPLPRFEDGGIVYVHHSLDGRKQNE